MAEAPLKAAEQTSVTSVAQLIVGVQGSLLALERGGEPDLIVDANVALVLATEGAWMKVATADWKVGWLLSSSFGTCTGTISRNDGSNNTTIQDAAVEEVYEAYGPIQLLTFRVQHEEEPVDARRFRIVCTQPDAQLGHTMQPFVSSSWPAAMLNKRLFEEHGLHVSCDAEPRETWRIGAGTVTRIAALHGCQGDASAVVAVSNGVAPNNTAGLDLSVSLLRAREVDLDGDGSAEWVLELKGESADEERRDLWLQNADASKAELHTLYDYDETSPSARAAWLPQAGQGVWTVVTTVGATSCSQLHYRQGQLTSKRVAGATCTCLARALRRNRDLASCVAR